MWSALRRKPTSCSALKVDVSSRNAAIRHRWITSAQVSVQPMSPARKGVLVPDPEILPNPDDDEPPQPTELPADDRPGQDVPELPDRGDPLGNDVTDGPDGLDIGPQ